MSLIDDSLVAAGAATVTGSNKEASPVEVYWRGSIMADANLRKRNLNVRGLDALDPRTLKEGGTPWDFSLKKDR